MLISAEDRLTRARLVLERRGLAADDLLSRPIAESWRRCLAVGLDPRNPPPLAMVDSHALHHAREQAALLRRLVLGEMETLYHQIAGTNFMIAFAAADGMLLDTICDPTFSATARATSIRPGTLWSEGRCGTNALGTVAETGAPATVHGGEHFFARYGELTCIAVPVFAPDGALAGVLDASSDCRSRQQHTQALVSMAAAQVENGLFRECHRAETIIAFHSRPEYLHTLSAGLLAVDQDGGMLAVNGRARFLLEGLPAAGGRRFEELFRTRLGDLLHGAADAGQMVLEDRVGSVFAARLETAPRPRPVAVALPARVRPAGFVAEDPAVAAVLRQVEAAAVRKLPILIRGATGTGKERLARHAHEASSRQGAFVPVNCAGISDSLVEAEIFGHAEGAFTGARRGGAPGLVVESDGGTLFLDEIGDMKLPLQSVLLRLLDDWTVRPVGGGRRRQVDVLVVAATNVDLELAVAEGRFRADLLYRINMVDVTLPPLHQRADFAVIAQRMLAGIAPRATLHPEALAVLAARPWPGNFRQLRSELTRLTLVDPALEITAETLLGEAASAAGDGDSPGTLRTMLQQRVRAVHEETGGNVAETARRLGVSRNTVYRAL